MSNAYNKQMIETVAKALGDELLREVAFVGGCTTGLLLTDDFSKESVRYTDDVDLIVNVVGYAGWNTFRDRLLSKGFRESIDDEIICRMRLGELKVDFMPDDEDILGFSNRWYSRGLETAQPYVLNDDLAINLLTPVYFIATKLEAYLGRGNNDPLASFDVEDVLVLFDGREEIVSEIKLTDPDVREYIATQISQLLGHRDFEYVVNSLTRGDVEREMLIFQRLEIATNFADNI